MPKTRVSQNLLYNPTYNGDFSQKNFLSAPFMFGLGWGSQNLVVVSNA